MSQSISKESIQQLFTEARSHHAWTDRPIASETLHQLYELMKWGPTSINSNPARIQFVQSPAAKEKLYPALMGSNVDQVKAAPVTAIVAYDEKFFLRVKELFPAFDATPLFSGNPALSTETAFRNSSLQGAYMILAARALGLDACPMSGFNNAAVDEIFFTGTALRSNFICTLGYGDKTKLPPRSPRLTFEEVCKIL